MNLKVQLLLSLSVLTSLPGCWYGAESRAVDLCFKQAPQVEAGRDQNIKGTLGRSFEVREIGSAHFLVEVNYQVVTMENPNPSEKDFWSIRTLTCEVRDGKIVDGSILGSKADQVIRRMKQK